LGLLVQNRPEKTLQGVPGKCNSKKKVIAPWTMIQMAVEGNQTKPQKAKPQKHSQTRSSCTICIAHVNSRVVGPTSLLPLGSLLFCTSHWLSVDLQCRLCTLLCGGSRTECRTELMSQTVSPAPLMQDTSSSSSRSGKGVGPSNPLLQLPCLHQALLQLTPQHYERAFYAEQVRQALLAMLLAVLTLGPA
jgi:hypothetical protein